MPSARSRIFTGWNRPFLDLAIPAWIAHVRASGVDPARVVLVLPGRRAARRAEERIAEFAPRDWPAPRIATESDLPHVLARERLVAASDWQRSLAWRRACERTPPDVRERLWHGAGEVPVGSLARFCARTFAELAADALEPDEIARRAANQAELGPAERWSALAHVVREMRAELVRSGVVEPSDAAAELVRRGRLREDLHVHLAGVVDIARAQRALLERVAVTAFVFAPAELSGDFDELGALRAERWTDRDVEIPLASWRAVDGPDDQAREALAHLASLAPPPRPEQVTLGVADADVLPYLERRLIDAGCEPRWAGGRPLRETRAAQLVAALLAWIDTHSTESFAALLRHPDVEAALELAPGAAAAALDAYVAEHVPARIDGTWRASPHREPAEAAKLLESAHAALERWIGDLAHGGARAGEDWAQRIAAVFERAWPLVDLAATDRDAWVHARSIEAFAKIVGEARDADSAGSPPLDARAALETLAECIESVALPPAPPQPGRPVVELVGWLEIALDDAEHVVLTGVNEGSLPERASRDAMLFEAARRALGLSDESRRVARDAYALTAVLASRPGVRFVSGRRSSRRDLRLPSRFLFRANEASVVERVRKAWPSRAAELPLPAVVLAPAPPPIFEREPLTRLSVTAFASYMRSPYQFYVEHVLGLSTQRDGAVELDAMRFGSLAHAVLESFGRSNLRDSPDEAALREMLRAELGRLERERFGDAVGPTVRLQVEQLRRRLDAFAAWQATQAHDGWRVHSVELGLRGKALDGMELRGRIDRVDVHADGRRWRILDYKTGDSGKSAKDVHGAPGDWKDLQLPLYRYLTEESELARIGVPALGFVRLAKDENDDAWSELELDPDGYQDALREASRIVECVRRREFADVGEPPRDDPILAGLCGFGLARGVEDEEEAPE